MTDDGLEALAARSPQDEDHERIGHRPHGTQCTCGGEDSDGRMDVLRCRVHGIGPEPWEQDEDHETGHWECLTDHSGEHDSTCIYVSPSSERDTEKGP